MAKEVKSGGAYVELGVKDKLDKARAGVGAVGAVVAALTSPIALVAAGIGVVVVTLATMTSVFDPVVNYLSKGFSWLSGLVSGTLTGITAAFSTGDLGKAAAIAFTGIRLVVSQTMESVLGIFGSSIGEMSRFLAELYKQIGTVVGLLNEARANFSQRLAQGIGAVAGPKDFTKDPAKNTAETAKGIRELIAIVPTIAPRFS